MHHIPHHTMLDLQLSMHWWNIFGSMYHEFAKDSVVILYIPFVSFCVGETEMPNKTWNEKVFFNRSLHRFFNRVSTKLCLFYFSSSFLFNKIFPFVELNLIYSFYGFFILLIDTRRKYLFFHSIFGAQHHCAIHLSFVRRASYCLSISSCFPMDFWLAFCFLLIFLFTWAI